jgi:hypothetical protein
LELISFLKFKYAPLEVLELLNGIPLLLLAQFGTLSVSADALALLAIAAIVSIEGAFIEQFRHFICVEVSFGDLAPHQEATSECLLLEKVSF